VDSGIIKLLNESHDASPAYPLKSCLARILGRKFSQVIGSNQTQQKHWKGLCPNQTSTPGPAKKLQNTFYHKTVLCQTLTSNRWQGKKSGAGCQPPVTQPSSLDPSHNGFAPWSKLQKHRRVETMFFFELMPCTLEALTVIKTFCL